MEAQRKPRARTSGRAQAVKPPVAVPINPDFFKQDPGRIATGLLGKVIRVGTVEAAILDADGYRREENEKDGLYRPLLTMEPGSVYCPRRRNAFLFLVCTHDRGTPGGCVLVRAAEIDGVVYDGPGRVTQRLGIGIHGTIGRLTWASEDSLIATMDMPLVPVEPSSGTRARVIPREGNGIGMETLQKMLPQFARVYLANKPGKPFEEFVNNLLAECADARALRRALAALRK